jgi:hypothetical protein
VFRAVTHHDLPRAITQSVVGCQLICDRLAQFRDASAWRVFRKTGFQRLDCGPFYVLWCIEIRFASTEAADIDPFGFHGFRLAID